MTTTERDSKISGAEARMDEERERLPVCDIGPISIAGDNQPNKPIPSQGATRDRGIQGIVERRDKTDKVTDCDK